LIKSNAELLAEFCAPIGPGKVGGKVTANGKILKTKLRNEYKGYKLPTV
jgi:hypothetical protein